MIKNKYILLIILILFNQLPSYAQEGSLKINLDINYNEDKNETTYIEQQNDLTKLFQQDITHQINQHYQQSYLQQQQFIHQIFLNYQHHTLNH